MVYLIFYLLIFPLMVVAGIGALVFLKNTLKDLKDEEIFDTAIVESRILKADNEKEASIESPSVPREQFPDMPEPIDTPEPLEESEVIEEPRHSNVTNIPDWPKIIEKVSSLRIEENSEAEQFAMTYFMQYGASKIDFPRECTICGNRTSPRVLKWKAIHKIPALRGAKASARKDTNNLWTIVGNCSDCGEKFILATKNVHGMIDDLQWVPLQHDNYNRLIAFNGRKVSKEKLGFVFRTLPDKSLIASGLTGEWIWLNGKHRSYV